MNDIEAHSQAIIDAARDGHDPTPEDRARVRSALSAALVPPVGVGAGASLPEAALHAAEVHAGTSTLVAKLLIGGSLVGATGLGAGYLAVRAAPPAARPTTAVSAPASASVPTERAPQTQAQATEAERGVDVAVPPAARSTRPIPPAPDVPATKSASSDSSLSQELGLLRQAQHALQQNEGQRSLALLDEMARRHPDGVLGEEAAAARVLALCSAGQTAEARVRAARFSHRYPDSVLGPRVRSSCASPAPAANRPSRPTAPGPQTDSGRLGQ